MSQEGNIWHALSSYYLFLAPTHVICVQQQQQLNVLSAGRFSVEPRLHCQTQPDEVRDHNTERHEQFLRPRQRPPVTDVPVGHASFKPSVGSSCKGGSRGTAPLSSCSFVCVFSPRYPSTHGYHPVYALCGFFTPLSFALLTQRLLWTSCEASASLVFSLSSLSLSLPVLVRACWYQSHWQALWTQLTFLSHSLARPLSLSLFFWFLLLL